MYVHGNENGSAVVLDLVSVSDHVNGNVSEGELVNANAHANASGVELVYSCVHVHANVSECAVLVHGSESGSRAPGQWQTARRWRCRMSLDPL